MTKAAATILICLCAAIAASSQGQVISVTKAPTVTGLDGTDLYRARHVLNRFFATSRPECYRVLFSTFQGNLRVDFVPKRADPVIAEGEPEDRNAGRPCGRNVGYVIDQHGRILRRIFSR